MSRTFVVSIAALAIASTAHGAFEAHDASVELQRTSWNVDIALPQFDDMGGTRQLKSVSWRLEGHVEGSAAGENLNATPAAVTLELAAEIELFFGKTLLDVVLPLADVTFDAEAHDGLMDFAGDSGASYAGLMNDDIAENTISDDLAGWIGDGMVTLTGIASGRSRSLGAGNLVTQFATEASMQLRIEYEWTQIPAPSALALFGAAGVLASRRRR